MEIRKKPNLRLRAAKAEDLGPESDDFENGYVEDVQHEPATIDCNEKQAFESPAIDAKKFYFADHFDDVEASRDSQPPTIRVGVATIRHLWVMLLTRLSIKEHPAETNRETASVAMA